MCVVRTSTLANFTSRLPTNLRRSQTGSGHVSQGSEAPGSNSSSASPARVHNPQLNYPFTTNVRAQKPSSCCCIKRLPVKRALRALLAFFARLATIGEARARKCHTRAWAQPYLNPIGPGGHAAPPAHGSPTLCCHGQSRKSHIRPNALSNLQHTRSARVLPPSCHPDNTLPVRPRSLRLAQGCVASLARPHSCVVCLCVLLLKLYTPC